MRVGVKICFFSDMRKTVFVVPLVQVEQELKMQVYYSFTNY